MAYSMKEFEKSFGDYMKGYRDLFIPQTKGCIDFKNRPFSEAITWAQGRLVDDAEGMIAEWRKNDNPQRSSKLPVAIVGIGRDYTPTTGDYARIRGDAITVQLPHNINPDKTKNKYHEARAMVADRKIQVLFVASNEPTCRSMSLQFCLWVSAFKNRRFYAKYNLDGVDYGFPCVLEDPNVFGSSVDSGQKNLVMIAVDLTFREQFPLLYGDSKPIIEVEETNVPTEYKRKIDATGVTLL